MFGNSKNHFFLSSTLRNHLFSPPPGGNRGFTHPSLVIMHYVQVRSWKAVDKLSKNDVIVMATDGLWDVISNKVIHSLSIVQFISHQYETSAELGLGGRGCSNILTSLHPRASSTIPKQNIPTTGVIERYKNSTRVKLRLGMKEFSFTLSSLK